MLAQKLIGPEEQSPSSGKHSIESKLMWLLVLVFFVAIFPFVKDFIKHHPDERHYTDAAITMVQSGDYLVPRTSDDTVRLKKPILTYWLVASSYKVFGITPFASRFPFLLLGCAVIPLTYRLACEITGSRRTSLCAACAVAVQPAVIISSMRSIPDIVLTVFLLVTAIGFTRLYKREFHDWRSLTFAYMGLALAIQSKGLPAVVFGLICIGTLLYTRFERVHRQVYRHALLIGVGCLVAFGWFAYVYAIYREQFLMQFFGDQVGDRVNEQPFQIVFDFFLVLILVILCSLPWSLALVESIYQTNKLKPRLNSVSKSSSFITHSINSRPELWMIGGWSIVYLLLASCVDRVNIRYQCPVSPFLACFIGLGISRLATARQELWFSRLRISTGVGLTFGLSLLLGFAWLFSSLNATVIASSVLLSVWLLFVMLKVTSAQRWNWNLMFATISLLLFAPLSYVAFSAFAYSQFEPPVLAALEKNLPAGGALSVFTCQAHSSRLSVVARGATSIEYRGHATALLRSHRGDNPHDAMLLSVWDTFSTDLSEYNVTQIPDGYWGLTFGDVFQAVKHGKLYEYLKDHQNYLIVATRKPEILMARAEKARQPTKISAMPAVFRQVQGEQSAVSPASSGLNVYR